MCSNSRENAEPNASGSGWIMMDLNGLLKFILILWIRASGFDRIWNDLFRSEWIWLDIYGRLVLMDLAGFWADVADFDWIWLRLGGLELIGADSGIQAAHGALWGL